MPEYDVKKKPKKGVCRMIEDGKRCKELAYARGICQTHRNRFRSSDDYAKTYEKYAAPSLYPIYDTANLKVNRRPRVGQCRLVVNSEECFELPRNRGLCGKHWAALHRRGLLDDFGS